MLADQIVEWKRIGNTVQLIAKNYAFTGGANAPIAQGVKEGFTDSLLGATTVASQPHPGAQDGADRRERAAPDRHPGRRALHRPASTCGATRSTRRTRASRRVRNSPDQSSFVVSAHYQNPRATLPPAPTPTPPPPSPFPPFTTLPDGRSLFLGYTYNFAKLPGADGARGAPIRASAISRARSGTSRPTPKFTAQDALRQPLAPREEGSGRGAVRAEGADRLLDRPQRSREVPRRGARRHPRVEQGVREDRLQGRDRRRSSRPPTRTFDTYDARHASVRWFVSTDAGFAIGPSTVDPRTGEILERAGRDSRRRGRASTARSSRSRRRRRGRRSTRTRRRSTSTAACARMRRTRSPRCEFGLDVLVDARRDRARQPRGRRVRRRRR